MKFQLVPCPIFSSFPDIEADTYVLNQSCFNKDAKTYLGRCRPLKS